MCCRWSKNGFARVIINWLKAGRMTRKNLHIERRRQVLEALHACLLKKPFDQTSIKDIAAEAKINHGVLHYYFKSKEDILHHYIEYVIDKYKTLFGDWLATQPDQSFQKPGVFIRACFDFMHQKITLNQDLSKIFIEIWEIAIYNETVREKLRKAYTQWIDTVNDTLRGMTGNAVASKNIGVGIVAFLEGISLFSVILNADTIDAEALLNAFQDQFIRIIQAE